MKLVGNGGGRYLVTPAWRRLIGVGWLLHALALSGVGVSSLVIGRPVIWLDNQRWNSVLLVLFSGTTVLALIGLALWSFSHEAWVPHLSCLATAILASLAVLDRKSSPGSAVVTLALTVSALLLTIASFAGRYRPNR